MDHFLKSTSVVSKKNNVVVGGRCVSLARFFFFVRSDGLLILVDALFSTKKLYRVRLSRDFYRCEFMSGLSISRSM
jgi:hypothetical protein